MVRSATHRQRVQPLCRHQAFDFIVSSISYFSKKHGAPEMFQKLNTRFSRNVVGNCNVYRCEAPTASERRSRASLRKTPPFLSNLYIKQYAHFAKTGSGQTHRKQVEKKGRFSHRRHAAAGGARPTRACHVRVVTVCARPPPT